jgi:hypothetical protein
MRPDLSSQILTVLRASPQGLSTRRVCQQIGRGFDAVRPMLSTLSDYGEIHLRFDLWHFGPAVRITYNGDENLAAMQKHSLETTS